MFVIKMPVGKIGELTRRTEMTVIAWFEMCRTVCTFVLVERGKMVGIVRSPFKSMRLGLLDDGNTIEVVYWEATCQLCSIMRKLACKI